MTSTRLTATNALGTRREKLSPSRLGALVLSLLGLIFYPGSASAHVYQFDNTTAAAIPTVGGTVTTVYTSTGGSAAITNNGYDGSFASMTCKTITVASEPGFDTIGGPVTITVPIDHNELGNLVIKLRAPGPVDYTLMSRAGFAETNDLGTEADIGDDSDLQDSDAITFSMAAADEAEAMGAGFGGDVDICADSGPCIYNPNAGATAGSDNLASLNGTLKNGSWTLCVADATPGGDTDTDMDDWTLNLGSIVGGNSDSDCDDGTSSLNTTFIVGDTFTATTIAVGINATHNERGDIRASIVAPDGTMIPLFNQSADADDNYDIVLTDNDDTGEPGTGPLDDASIDPTAEPYFNRIVTNVAGLSPGGGEAAFGTWTLRVCDRDDNGITGTLNRARLVLLNATAATAVCTSRMNYEWGDNGNDLTFNLASIGGINITQAAGDRVNYSSGFGDNHVTLTGTANGETGYYSLFMDAANVGGTQPYEGMGQLARFNFSQQISDLQFSLFDSDQAPDDFEDVMRVEGSSAGALRRYQRNIGTAHQVAGDTIEGDDSISGAQGTSTYIFDRSVDTMRVYYFEGGDRAPTDAADQFTGIANLQFCAFDFGDAPDTFGTLLASDGARHVLGARQIYLGSNPPDGESEGDPIAAATEDDTTQVGGVDDEDGTTPFSPCPNDTTYSATVNASDVRTSGADGAIRGYIDWSRDGDFNDVGEMSAATTVPRANADPTGYVLNWSSVPANCGGTTDITLRFRISTDTVAIASPTGLAPDGEVEDYVVVAGAGTFPVTLASIESELSGGNLTVSWTTASESGNAGFRLWGYNTRGERNLLSTVKSQSPDSFGVQRYEAVVPGKGVARIEIEDVSVFGGESRFHGPYAIGSAYGVEPADASVDWSAIRSESGVVGDVELMAAAERGESSVRSMIAMSREKQGRLLVREEGIHRVTYEQLRSAGVDFAGIKHGQIAVTNHGVAVPRHIQAMGSNFGPGASIEFVARPELTLASPVDVYVVQVNPSKVKVAGAMAAASGVTRTIDATDLHESEVSYSYAAPNGDPWYEQGLLAWGGSASLSRSFDLPDLAAGAVAIDLRTWGIGDWPGSSPEDHHVVVRLNGSEIADRRFDGPIALDLTLDVTGLVQESGNTLEVVAPGDTGFELDYIAYDSFTVRYRRSSEAIDGRFVAKGVPGGNVAIGSFDPGALVSVWRLAGVNGQRGQQTPVGGQVFSTGNGDLFAAAGAAIRTPAILAGIPAAKTSSGADYVIVTHPVFADAVGDLVALQEAKGLSTEVVTVDRIYAAYSDHAASPSAIRSFFSASLAKGMQYALIVGADSSDPYDHLGLGSVSYVPTDYLPLNTYVQFSPTDESLVDADGDGLGDAAIGRFPARTVAELEAMVAKLYAWESQVATGRTALLAAGISDTEAAHMDAINDSYAATLAEWSPGTAAVDELGSAAARVAVLEALNGGTKLVSYVGHSSMGQWDWTPLLQWQDAASLTNNGAPNLVTAWGCWNSYYVEPTIESLSARLLRQPNAGAAAAIGATTLTSEASHQALGNLFFQQVNAGATRVGDAFRAAKQALAAQGGQQDAILGMTLLGDPAMSLPPAE